mgnify:CR=1 FL=1
MPSDRVVALVVTWNRRELLAESLRALQSQTRPPEAILVVDNASDDGTAELLSADFPDVRVIRNPVNTGGAGGFATGLEHALAGECDAVWLMDDDTVPEPGALAALLATRSSYAGDGPRTAPPAVVASRVVWTDGRDHPMNTPRTKAWASRAEREAAAAVGARPGRTASFVSILVDAERARQVGLPVPEYFLWNDDFEYTARLIRGRRGLWAAQSVVVHKTKAFAGADQDPGPRFYYEVRNKLWTLVGSPGLAPAERVVFGAATARRWARTIAGSSDRGTLWKGLRRGVREGLSEQPASLRALPSLSGPSAAPPTDLDPTIPRRTTPRRSDGFSVLLPYYHGDRPDALETAFRSVTVEQTRRPAQVVLVRDGVVDAALQDRVALLIADSVVPVTHVELGRNRGLGPALNHGLAHCDYDIVARMDADDVSLPQRFERQIELMEAGYDLVGATIEEFADSPEVPVGRRDALTDPVEIAAQARFEQTLNHPVVVYRASMVDAAGGYQDLPSMEDYLLFAQLIQAGARVANVAEPLLRYRVSAGAFHRRGGVTLLRSEIEVQRRFLAMGFTTPVQAGRNVVLRGAYRLTPEPVRRTAYRAYHRLRSHSRDPQR